MPLAVGPGAAVQLPDDLIRNHQLGGPSLRVRSTERSSFTVAVRLAGWMVNVVAAIWLLQPPLP